MRRIDYDTEQYRDYARGRALTGEQMRVWIDAFEAQLPTHRPLAGLDIGSGTGRYTPALAQAFGPAIGVEPFDRMREIAQEQSRHPDVRYVAGSAEDIPVPSGCADYALMYLSWAHVQDKPKAVGELARVIRPGGRLLLRTQFSDHLPDIWWLRPFPRHVEAHAAHFDPLHETIAAFTSRGWRVASFGTVTEPSPGTYADLLERLKMRTFSVFAQFTPDELEIGFQGLEQIVAAQPDAPAPTEAATMLTLERP